MRSQPVLHAAEVALDPRAFADTYRYSRAIYTQLELLQPMCGDQQLYPGCAGFCGVCARLPSLQHLDASQQREALGQLDIACQTNPLLTSMLQQEIEVRFA
jgi:hypothetical protein